VTAGGRAAQTGENHEQKSDTCINVIIIIISSSSSSITSQMGLT